MEAQVLGENGALDTIAVRLSPCIEAALTNESFIV